MSTIPYHTVEHCRNIYSRFGIFDELMDTVFRGGPIAARATIESYGDEQLLREYDYYSKGESCCTCFWKLLHTKYTGKNSPTDTNGVFYFEVECRRADLDDERSLQRLMKQQTDPIEAYIYEIVGDETCRVRCAYKPTGGKRILTRTLERSFPDGSVINNKLNISPGRLNMLKTHETAVRSGF
jgi:hypothetical protein